MTETNVSWRSGGGGGGGEGKGASHWRAWRASVWLAPTGYLLGPRWRRSLTSLIVSRVSETQLASRAMNTVKIFMFAPFPPLVTAGLLSPFVRPEPYETSGAVGGSSGCLSFHAHTMASQGPDLSLCTGFF